MKEKINHKLRVFLIALSAVLLITFSTFLFCTWKYPGTVEEKITKYQYTQKANVDYEVVLKPNIVYDEKTLDMGQVYVTNFVDHINTTVNYKFSGDREANIKGNYSVIAKVQAIQKEGKDVKIAWSKDFVVVPLKTFNVENKEINLNEQIPINLNTYAKFAERVKKTTGIMSNIIMTIDWDIKAEVETDEGVIKEELSPNLVLPLGTNSFEIEGELTKEKEGAIEEVLRSTVPMNMNKVGFFGAGIGISIITLVFLIFFVKGYAPTFYEKEVKQIFKKHGEKLVALDNEITINQEGLISVKSIEDLVRIADEICKPIYYKNVGKNDKKGLSYYVISDSRMFSFKLKPTNSINC